MLSKTKSRLTRITRECPQCRRAIAVFLVATDEVPAESLASLCEHCAPDLYSKCHPLPLIPDPSERRAPPLDNSEADHDPVDIQEFRRTAWDSVLNLSRLASRGNQLAADRLAEITFCCVKELQALAEAYPHMLRPTARQDIVWPYFVSKWKWYHNYGRGLLDRLEVGKDALFGQGWHGSAPATMTAMLLRYWVSTNARTLGLPALSPETRAIWFEVGWRRLLFETKGAIHKDPFLGKIGRSARHKKNPEKRYMPVLTARMRQQDVTAKIKEIVRKSFFNVVGSASVR